MAISLRKAEDAIVYGPEQDCIVLVSPPGTGKSSAAVRAAKRMGSIYLPVYTATMEAVDGRGLPMPTDGPKGMKVVTWAAPSFLPLAVEMDRYKGQNVLVNFDDWFQAPPPVLRATVRSIYGDGAERRIGDFPIYPNTRFIATGNREQDRAGVYRPETYVNDRITYLEIEPDVDDWASGAMHGFSAPELDVEYAEKRARINAAVGLGIPDELIAYVKWSKQCYDFSTEQRSFLSPRSIERLGRFLRAFDAAGINGDTMHQVACGTIGDAHAMKFMAFRALRSELPDTDAILRGEAVKLPARSEVLYILCTNILRAAKEEHVQAVGKFLGRLAKVESANGMRAGVEISVYLFRECISGAGKALRKIATTKEGHDWLAENGTYFT